ncbi:MAG: S46 family peptidase, partial [Bdellovibrio sp.]
ADEGMWLFNHLPKAQLQKDYGFNVTAEFVDNLMRSSVRISYGGSGSFVSGDGLVLTNHHVASEAIDSLSKADQRDYMSEGFVARSLAEEKNPKDGLEIEALVSIVDVTDQVVKAVQNAKGTEAQNAARKRMIAEITATAEKKSGLKSQVVTLYQGGQYHLYQFKIYTDVRLVFAPEKDIAFFGGDADNFEFPRFNLDMALFRVYENGQPARIQNYLKLPKAPLQDGDLIFVSGNPGSTQRLLTSDALKYLRDYQLPLTMEVLWRLESLYGNYQNRGPAEKMQIEDDYFGVANSRKARRAQLLGLQDPKVFGELEKKERHLKKEMQRLGMKEALAAYRKIAQLQKELAQIQIPYSLLERGSGFNSDLFSFARTLIRASVELKKPDGDRLEEFNQSRLKSLELKLFSEKKLYPEVEILKLTDALSFLKAKFGRDPQLLQVYGDLLRDLFADQGPSSVAEMAVLGTRLFDSVERQRLFKMSEKELRSLKDPMIQLAWRVDSAARKLRKIYEEKIKEVEKQAYNEISKARFKILGDAVYPDATFSPRVAFGRVNGFKHLGSMVPPFTEFAGLYQREQKQKAVPPFVVPVVWKNKKSELDLSTPFNFVSTADIIGGNSGSPTVNARGELVGLIFDGNIYSLTGDYIYDEKVNRAVSVDTRAMLHALEKIYQAEHVLASFGKDSAVSGAPTK